MLETPRGMDDLLPEEVRVKRKIEDVIREVYRLYGYEEVETPTVEYLALFEAKSGEEIRHRMYRIPDIHGRTLVLRPEVTASIARLVASKLSKAPTPIRLGYIADCYRYDEPQWGRRRRFWHGGLELFGCTDPMADAEIVLASYDVFRMLNIADTWFRFGHVGIVRGVLGECGVGERLQDMFLTAIDRKQVAEAFERVGGALSDEAAGTLQALLQLRGDYTAGRKALDILSPWPTASKACENLLEIVDEVLQVRPGIRYVMDFGFARGLEYYTGFIFEQGVSDVEISFNGGGRYDRLVGLFGGRETPAVGCAIGITRIMSYLLRVGAPVESSAPKILISIVSDRARGRALHVATTLRENGIPATVDVSRKRVGDAIELAVKKGIRYVGVIGERELESDSITVRDLEKRRQDEISVGRLVDHLKNNL